MKVKLPNGQIANFPDTMSPDEVKAILRKKFPPKGTQAVAAGKMNAQTPPVDQGSDMLTGLKSGAMRGITGLGGMIGDAQQVMGDVASWGAGKLGASPETQQIASEAVSRFAIPGIGKLPTSTQLQGAAETVTGPIDRPQGFAGQTIEKIGEFAPGAIAGPGGVLRRAALAAVPAVASEVAGRIPGIEGSGAQPYVEMGAALAAGMPIAAKSGAKTVMADMRKAAPSHAEVKAAKTAAYKDLDSAGISYDANAYRGAAMRIKSDLNKKGYDKMADSQVRALVNRVDDILKPKKVASWTRVDDILKDAKAIQRGNADDTTKLHVGIIIRNLENVAKNAPIKSRGNLTRAQINERIDTAREFARRDIVAKEIEKMKGKMPGYLSGDESASRNQFGAYLRNAKFGSLSDAEKAAFGTVVRREGPLNTAHMLGSRWGNIAGGATGSIVGGALGSVMGPAGTAVGAMAGVPVSMAAGAGFRRFMDKFTEKAVDDALKTVLAGRAAQKIATSAAEKERIRASIRASLLAAQAAPEPANSVSGQPVITAP
jgi:hypothetical protein